MPNFNSDLIAAKNAVDVANKQVDGDRTSGILLYATALVTIPGTLAANDTLALFDLPAGSVVVPQLSHATSADPGAALVLHVGDAGDVDRYAAAIVLSNGGQVGFASTTPPPAAVTAPFRPARMTRVFATIATATTITANTVLAFTVVYRCKA